MWRKKSKGTIKCEKRTVIYDVGTAQYEDEIVKCEKKSKGTAKSEKIIVTCDVGTALCKDGTVKCEKKVRESPNMIKELLYVILELHNVRMKPSNVRKIT